MSVFLCSDKHIATVATALFADPKQAQAAANVFKHENLRSVNARYQEKTRFKKCDMSGADLAPYTGHDIAQLLTCIDYQSSMHSNRNTLIFNLCFRILDYQKANKILSSVWSI